MQVEPTRFFYELTPDRVLAAVEQWGVRCTGRCLQLNSMENRVYEIEVETEGDAFCPEEIRQESALIVKFYRPGRWSRAQIEQEHAFLLEGKADDIPVVAPLKFSGDETLREVEGLGIFFSLFPKVRGRSPDELNDEQRRWLGRLIGRLHLVGARGDAPDRLRLTPAQYGRKNLEFLRAANLVPPGIGDQYADVIGRLCDIIEPWFEDASFQRIHGDAHLGNILWGGAGPFFVDFDDMVVGPAVQDLWLLAGGQDDESQRALQVILEGYEQIRAFDRATLRLIEPLRALRYIHFAAWIGKRWEDPAFRRAFDFYGTTDYWHEQLDDLQRQYEIVAT